MRSPAPDRNREPGSRLRAADVVPVAARGMTLRPARSILSGIGIAIGIATLVAVLGISRSSQSQLVAEIDALGTNLLTVSPGSALSGQNASLPPSAAAMIDRVGPVLGSAGVYDVSASVYRSDRVPVANTDAISVYSADTGLLHTLQGQMARGRFLTPATAHYPVVVLGADAAAALGIDQAGGR